MPHPSSAPPGRRQDRPRHLRGLAAALALALVGATALWFGGALDLLGSAETAPRTAAAPATGAQGTDTALPPGALAGPRDVGPGAPGAADERRTAQVPAAASAGDLSALAGRVLDGAGRPVSSFHIEVFSKAEVLILRAEASFEDPEGRFHLPAVPPGTWLVVARAPGYAPQAPVETTVPRAGELLLVLRALGAVAGLVRDPFGAPIAEARVLSGNQEVRSGADGRFEFALEHGTQASLFATKEGFGPSELLEVLVPAEERVELELSLAVEALVRGVVLDGQGRPEPGAEVHLGEFRGDRRTRNREQVADADGRFEFRELPAGGYLVLVDEGSGPTESQRALRAEQVLLAAGETLELVLGGARADGLLLTVTATLAGKPCDAGKVFVFPEGPNFLAGTHEAKLDALGRATFQLPGPGRYAVRAERSDLHEAHVTHPLEIPDVPVFEIELALPAAGLRGHVRSPQGPVALRRVTSVREQTWDPTAEQGRSAVTDADGAFWIDGLAPGRYSLHAPGAQPLHDVELGLDEQRGGLELTLEAAGSVLGRVLDAGGKPASEAAVYARGPDGRWLTHWVGAASRSGDGQFGFGDLPPGDYTFFARRAELASQESAPVRVVAGEVQRLELVLQPAAMLSLSLVDGTGAPLPAAGFRALDEHQRSYGEPRSAYDLETFLREGFQVHARFIGPLPPGTWWLEARAEDGRRAALSATLAPGWNELELRLE